MILTYYPDVDLLEVDFEGSDASEESSQVEESAVAYDADSEGTIQAIEVGGRLRVLVITQASEQAPRTWDVPSLRREAARVAAATGDLVTFVRFEPESGEKSFATGGEGPYSEFASDEAVQEYNTLVRQSRSERSPDITAD